MSGGRPALWARLRGHGLGAVLARGAAGGLAVQVAGAVLQLGLQGLMARWLGESQYGVYAYVLVWVQVLLLLARLGLDTVLVRFVAEYRVSESWGLLRGLVRRSNQVVAAAGVALALLAAVVLALLGGWLTREQQVAGWLGCVLLPLWSQLGLSRGVLQGLRRVVAAQVPEAVLRPLLIAACVALTLVLAPRWLPGRVPDAHWGLLLTLVASVLTLGVASWWQRRALPAPVHRQPAEFATRLWLDDGVPLLLVSGMRQLLVQTDVLVVGLALGATEAGIYFIASRLAQLVSFGLLAGNAIAAPLIAELHSQGKMESLRRVVAQTVWGSTLFSLLCAGVLVAARGPLLAAFGPAFAAAGTTLVILAAGQLVNAVTGPVGQLLNMTGYPRANARILLVVAVLNLLCSYPAAVTFGMAGAAWVTAALVAVKNLWTWYEVRSLLGVNSSIFARWPGAGRPS